VISIGKLATWIEKRASSFQIEEAVVLISFLFGIYNGSSENTIKIPQ